MSSTQRTETATSSLTPGSLVKVTLAGAFLLIFTLGCSSKNYVRSQTSPIIDQSNQLDAKTATDHRNIVDTDERAQKGIAQALETVTRQAAGQEFDKS